VDLCLIIIWISAVQLSWIGAQFNLLGSLAWQPPMWASLQPPCFSLFDNLNGPLSTMLDAGKWSTVSHGVLILIIPRSTF
jgi:hypothetical protein